MACKISVRNNRYLELPPFNRTVRRVGGQRPDADVVALDGFDEGLAHAVALGAGHRREAGRQVELRGEQARVPGGVGRAVIGQPFDGVRRADGAEPLLHRLQHYVTDVGAADRGAGDRAPGDDLAVMGGVRRLSRARPLRAPDRLSLRRRHRRTAAGRPAARGGAGRLGHRRGRPQGPAPPDGGVEGRYPDRPRLLPGHARPRPRRPGAGGLGRRAHSTMSARTQSQNDERDAVHRTHSIQTSCIRWVSQYRCNLFADARANCLFQPSKLAVRVYFKKNIITVWRIN